VAESSVFGLLCDRADACLTLGVADELDVKPVQVPADTGRRRTDSKFDARPRSMSFN